VDDGSCLYGCDLCSELALIDGGDEVLANTTVNVYDVFMQLIQTHHSHQIDEDYIGVCTEEAGCYFLEIITDAPGDPVSWSMTIDGNFFSGVGPGVYGFSPSGTMGCTEENAANYDVDASCDDGSCIFPGCTDPEACNFDPNANQDDGSCQSGAQLVLGFSNSTLSNNEVSFAASNALGQTLIIQSIPVGGHEVSFCLPYECNTIIFNGIGMGDTYSITTNAGGDLLLEGGYEGLSNASIQLCIDDEGCMDPNACNYTPIAIVDDGSCNYLSLDLDIQTISTGSALYVLFDPTGAIISSGQVGGLQNFLDNYCLDEGCYEVFFQSPDFSTGGYGIINFTINGIPLFVPVFVSVSGFYPFCIEYGCMDPIACNFNAQAYHDDGSCIYQTGGCNDPAACNYQPGIFCVENCVYAPNAIFTIVNGNQANVINYIIKNEANEILYEGAITSTLVLPVCLGPGCYVVLTSGMQITSPVAVDFWEMEFNGSIVSTGTGQNPNNDFCLYVGCTNPSSCAYNPTAGFDDGSCSDFQTVGVFIERQVATNETDELWLISSFVDPNNGNSIQQIVLANASFTGTHSEFFCLPNGCYEVIINEIADGDVVSIVDENGQVLWQGVGPMEYVAASICPGMGCMDAVACNYNAFADDDDGSCLYGTSGCTLAAACNYNPAATCNDGSCLLPGCNDTLACNYDPAAGCDDGSCLLSAQLHLHNVNNPVITVTISDDAFNLYFNGTSTPNQVNTTLNGCMPTQCYQVSVAGLSGADSWNLQVGSAIVASGNTNGVFNFCFADGCTALAACNYSPAAVHDDGSCFFLEGDFDGNLVVNTGDLLQFMAAFGCSGSCGAFDLDGNNAVNTGDLLQFMALFGSSCQ